MLNKYCIELNTYLLGVNMLCLSQKGQNNAVYRRFRRSKTIFFVDIFLGTPNLKIVPTGLNNTIDIKREGKY